MAERNWVPVTSKRFDACDYDPLSRTLYVRFHANKSGEKPVYAYAGVQPPLFEGLMNAESKGKFINENIISKQDEFPFQKIGTESAA